MNPSRIKTGAGIISAASKSEEKGYASAPAI